MNDGQTTPPNNGRGGATDNRNSRPAWSRPMLFVWWLVHIDPDILADCPKIDYYLMLSKAVLLSTVAGIAVFAWGGFFLQFWALYIALPLTAIVVVFVVMLDQFMGGASHWTLRGVLASPGKARIFTMTLVLRLGIALVTSSATSYSATMLIAHETIAAQEQRDRDGENTAKRAAGEAEKGQTWQKLLGPLDAQAKQAAADVDALNGQLDAARRRRDDASQKGADSKIEAYCQLHGGPKCHAGAGSEYNKALVRGDKAAKDQRQAEADIALLEPRIADAVRKHDEAVAAFHAREADYLAAAKRIDDRVAADAAPERDDPIMSYRALQRVFDSPDGAATRFFAHLLLALLLTIELSYVLVSEYFMHASIHDVRLIARTKIFATEIADEYRRKVASVFRAVGDPEGVMYRVLPRFPK